MLQFPKVSGRNLEDRSLTLPDDLTDDVNLLFVGYQRWHQPLIDIWMLHIQELVREFDRMAVYEIPIFQSGYRLFRNFIDGGMKLGIPNKAVRESTITIYTNITVFNHALGISSTQTIVVVLVDLNGRVLWSDEGDFDQQKFIMLRQTINQHLTENEITGS